MAAGKKKPTARRGDLRAELGRLLGVVRAAERRVRAVVNRWDDAAAAAALGGPDGGGAGDAHAQLFALAVNLANAECAIRSRLD